MENAVKKKFTVAILCIMMVFVFALTGCGLFPRNVNEYLNKSVCTITYQDNKKDEITTEAFINAYNSYGSSLVQNGTDTEEAMSQTLEVLISRYILLNYAQKKVSIEDEMENIYDEVYSSLVSNLDSYVTTVKTEWKLATTESEDNSDSSDIVKYEAYEPTAKVVKVKIGNEGDAEYEYKIELIDKDSKSSTHFSSIEEVISAFKNYANPTDTTNNAKVKKEAYKRFIATLRKNESGRNLSTSSDSILTRYANKLLKNSKENAFIEKLEEYYKSDSKYSTITVRQVLEKYKALVLQSKYKYESDSTSYDTAMLESFKDVYYAVDENYFFVSNLLMKFTDEQKTEYESIDKDAYLSPLKKEEEKAKLVNAIMAKVRNSDGEVDESIQMTATEVLNSLKVELNNATSDEQKAKIFNDYLYKYGEDTGVQNAEYMYVIGTSTSKMVESFTNASRELNDDGTFGAISDLVVSEYGVHVIFYGSRVTNLFTVNSIDSFNLSDSDIEKLCEAKLSALNNKTVFDKVFETLSNDSYSIFENMNINQLKSNVKIEKHKSVLDNL